MRCFGGPYHGQSLDLAQPLSGTLVFTAHGMKGRYVRPPKCHRAAFHNNNYLQWEEVK